MRKDFAKNAGLAAVILLAPGGFILAAALLADKYRKKNTPVAPMVASPTDPAE